MSSHGPIEAKQRERMNKLAAVLDDFINEGFTKKEYGFVLLVFPFDEPKAPGEARMNYISNAERPDVITALKELVANFEGRMQPDARGQ